MPGGALAELGRAGAPDPVRAFAASPPPCLPVFPKRDPGHGQRGAGEQAVTRLAERVGARRLLLDDRAAVLEARRRGFRVTGTLGLLAEAAAEDRLDLPAAYDALRATNFRAPPEVLETPLARDRARRNAPGGR